MDYTTIISQILMIVAVLTVFVNIITEVMKKAFSALSGSKTINIFVLILSVALTVAAFFAYWEIKQLEITWYVVTAFVVVGFMVAYAAMFGFDKLIKYFEKEGN